VGSIYINATDSTNPSSLLGFGTWVAFGAGRVLVGFNAADPLFDTAEETKFLNLLGTHAPDNVTSPGRKVLLWNYIITAGKRSDWGSIDKNKALEHANHLYSNL
jgi:hypothetical protein